MKEFLYKNSFIRFYTALSCERVTYKQNGFAPLVVFSALLFVGMLFTLPFFSNPIVFSICVCSLLFFMCSLMIGIRINTVPNFANIIPLSHAKKKAYYMLSPVFTMILVAIVVFLVMLFLYAISCIINACLGMAIEAFFDYEELYAVQEVGLFGGIFSAIYIIICYSMGMISGLTKKKLYKYLSLAAFVFINFLTFLLISSLSPVEDVVDYFTFVYNCSPFTNESYSIMPNLWVIILIFGLVAAGLLGYAIYLVSKRFSPKKY